MSDPSLKPQVDNHLNNELREQVKDLVFRDGCSNPDYTTDTILNIINQEKAKLVDSIWKELKAESFYSRDELYGAEGDVVAILKVNAIFNRIKQEEGLK